MADLVIQCFEYFLSHLPFLLCNLLYAVHSISLTDPIVRSEGSSSVCTVRNLPQPSSIRKLLRVPDCTQDPHRLHLNKTFEQRSFLNRLALLFSPDQNESLAKAQPTGLHGMGTMM